MPTDSLGIVFVLHDCTFVLANVLRNHLASYSGFNYKVLHMYDRKTFRYSEECSWHRETRRIYIRSRNKMAALGYVYTLRKQTLCSLYAVQVEMPPVLSPEGSYTSAHPCVWLRPVGVLCQALEACKNSVGRIIVKNTNMKKWNGVTATMTLLSHTNSRLHLGTLAHLTPWNKPIHRL